MSLLFTGTQFSNIVLSKFVGEQYMGNIDSEGSKLRSYFVNDLNASYEIKPKSVFKVIVLSVLVNNILIINISQTDISILMTMITLIHQQLKRLKEQGIIPKRESILVGLTLKF
jgi:iron complex outermembrane receptor protein